MSVDEPAFFRMDLPFRTASILGESSRLVDLVVCGVACFEGGRNRRSWNAPRDAGGLLVEAEADDEEGRKSELRLDWGKDEEE